MKLFHRSCEVFLGLIFVVFGLNGFLMFIPVPDFHPFVELLVESDFMIFIKIIEILAGVLLIIGRFQLLAIIFLGPVITSILLYHILMDPRNMVVGFVNIILLVIIMFGYKEQLKPLFKIKPKAYKK